MLISGSGMPIMTGIDFADRTPMRSATYYAPAGLSLTNSYAAYAELYKSQPWVYTLVRKLGTSTSRLPLKVYERISDNERRSARDTPYGELIRNPNPAMGAKLLWNWTASTTELYGEAMLFKLRDDTGRVRELHPMHPANMILRRNPDTGVLEYGYMAYSRAATLMVFDPSDIVHFRGYNPDNVTRGVSPCEPLRQTLLSEDAMRRGQQALWKNGARPSVSLSTDKTLSQGAIERLKAQWDSAHSGVDSWGKTAILEEGMTPHILQLNAEEMQYIQGRKLNREECCAVWDVPPPAVQILDRATFSNITEQMRSLYRETMAPRLEAYEDTLQSQLAIPDFSADGSLYAEFEMDAVLRGSFEARIEAKAKAIQTGQITPAESRAEENLPFMPGSDVLLVNAALIPMLAAQAIEPATGTEVELLPQRVRSFGKALSPKDADKVTRRLAKAPSLADVDETALLAHLDDSTQVLSLLRAAVARSVDVPTLCAWVLASAQTEEVYA